MKSRLAAAVALLLLALPAVICIGCEDAAAAQRDSVQNDLEAASRQLQLAISSGDEAKLNKLVSDLGSVSGGSTEQQAAKSMLLATAQRELAALKLAQANPIVGRHDIVRSGASDNLDAALRLSALASSAQAVDVSDQREALQQELDDAARRAQELRRRAQQLDGPISQQTDQNTSATAEAQKLRTQVAELRRRAQELGHSDGFEVYQQSVAADREADRIEIGVAQREIDLQYSLRPDYSLATSQADHLEAAVQIIEQTQGMLDTLASAVSTDAGASRQAMTALVSEVTGAVDRVKAESESELGPLYDAALAALDRAASSAETAARQVSGDATHAVRLLAARIREDIARVHWSRARTLASQRSLLERLTTSASALNVPPRYSEDLKAVSDAHQNAIEQAKSAMTAAQELLSQVSGRGDQAALDRFRTELDNAVAALNGRAAGPPAAPPTTPVSGAQSGAAAASATSFASSDELLQHLNALPDSIDGLKAQLALMKARTPDGQKFLRSQTVMIEGLAELDSAMNEKFGHGVFEIPSMKAMAASMPEIDPSSEIERADDKVVYEYDAPPAMGGLQRVALVKIDGSWWLSADEMSPQIRSMLGMMEQMAPQQRQMFTMLAQRIRAGEFQSAEQMQMALMQGMTGGAGAPGRPGAPGGSGTGPRR